jgi:hypothetical protein
MRYEVWALEQLRNKPRCRVEPSMRCIPLMNDPICSACYESDGVAATTGKDDTEGTKQKRGKG